MDPQGERILNPALSSQAGSTRAMWADRVRSEVTARLDSHPALSNIWKSGSVLLYGSTARGVDDAYSDIDLLLLVRGEDVQAVRNTSGTDFFDFPLHHKSGHMTVESLDLWQRRLGACQMPSIYQLRNAVSICGETAEVLDLLQGACQPLPGHVAHAFTAYHYVEMRSWHRSCDNAMERHDAVALLLLLPKALADAMRVALLIQGLPFPYEKWLYQELLCQAESGPLCTSISRILALLAQDGLHVRLRESANPISIELRTIRQLLIDLVTSRGWDAPWLDKWWLHMDDVQYTMEHTTWTTAVRQ